MGLENLVFLPSKSRYELELEAKGSDEFVRKSFSSEEIYDKIVTSHHKQKANISRVVDLFGSDAVVDRSKLNNDLVRGKDLFVFLGGDNHFTYCAQKVLSYLQINPQERKYVAGVVLDPDKSTGALLSFRVNEFLEGVTSELANLSRENKDLENYQVEKWTTLEGSVRYNSSVRKLLVSAIDEYFIGESARMQMSRNVVYLDGKQIFPDKSSGLLIATGSGSNQGSWYNNVYEMIFNESGEFPKESEYAKMILTEHRSRGIANLYKGQTLEIHSYNDDHGIISADCHEKHTTAFPMGAKAEIKVSDLKLRVLAGF